MLVNIPGFQWTPTELEIIKKNQKKFNKITEFSQIGELRDKLVCPDPNRDGEDYDDETEFALRPIILVLALKICGPEGLYFCIWPGQYERGRSKDKKAISIRVGVSICAHDLPLPNITPANVKDFYEDEISSDTVFILNGELIPEEVMDETIFRKFFMDWLDSQIYGGEELPDLINIDKICLWLLENYEIKMVIRDFYYT